MTIYSVTGLTVGELARLLDEFEPEAPVALVVRCGETAFAIMGVESLSNVGATTAVIGLTGGQPVVYECDTHRVIPGALLFTHTEDPRAASAG